MSVKCLSPVRLYGELAGEYERGQTYPAARLATEYPDHFSALPDPETPEPAAPIPDPGTPAPESTAPIPDAGTAGPAEEIPTKRKNRRHNP